MAKELDKAWKSVCESNMMEKSFSNVGLSLKIDGSEDHKMNFKGRNQESPKE